MQEFNNIQARLTKITRSEQQGLFEVAFAEIWRNAQRRRSAYIGLWVPQVFRATVNAWRNWWSRRGLLGELLDLDLGEPNIIANNLSLSLTELPLLANSDANAAVQLQRRLALLGLDSKAINPSVMRDLVRCCIICNSKRHCTHELEAQPSSADWLKYCPNSDTISSYAA